MPNNDYPASEGWVRMSATLTSAAPLTEAQIKNIASFGKPDAYQWGPMSQNGKRLRVISREIKRIPQLGEH